MYPIALQALGFESDRLKTGTPARVDRRTIDFSVLEEQPGEEELRWFSHDPALHVPREQMACHLTRTTAATHALIRANLHETPTYGGWVEARGPRYCPSIEDKIVRFADKDSHQIFLEPEGARGFCTLIRGGARCGRAVYICSHTRSARPPTSEWSQLAPTTVL